jgi:hypothetical protein
LRSGAQARNANRRAEKEHGPSSGHLAQPQVEVERWLSGSSRRRPTPTGCGRESPSASVRMHLARSGARAAGSARSLGSRALQRGALACVSVQRRTASGNRETRLKRRIRGRVGDGSARARNSSTKPELISEGAPYGVVLVVVHARRDELHLARSEERHPSGRVDGSSINVCPGGFRPMRVGRLQR